MVRTGTWSVIRDKKLASKYETRGTCRLFKINNIRNTLIFFFKKNVRYSHFSNKKFLCI